MFRSAAHILSIIGYLALGACSPPTEASSQASPYAIKSASTDLPFDRSDEDATEDGQLIFRGAIEIKSSNKAFGGISGLMVSPDLSAFLSVTDKGSWLRGQLIIKDGELKGVSNLEISPILNSNGAPIADKSLGDAEALTGHWAKGETWPEKVFVSFEQQHRINTYEFGKFGFEAQPSKLPTPHGLLGARSNSGLEGLVLLRGKESQLLGFAESPYAKNKPFPGWLFNEEGSKKLTLAFDPPFMVTDLAQMPNGDLLTLERRFSPVGGVGARLRRISVESLVPGKTLDGEELIHLAAPQTVDNMEGLDVRADEKGRTQIFIVSDDNFNPLQRTILMMFELKGES